MKTNQHKIGLLKNGDGVSIAFSVFIMFTVIIVFAIISLALAPVIDQTVRFNNKYMESNPSKYVAEVRQNQNSAYLFYDNFVIIMIITLASWMVVNAIKRSWQETGGE